MSSFSQESSVGNEVLVEKGKDSSVEIEEAVKNHVTDGAAATSNTTSESLGGRFFMLCEVMVPASIMVVIVGLFLIPTIYYIWPGPTVEVRIYVKVTGRKRTLSGPIQLVISLECFIEITPDFLCPFMND